MQRLLAILLLAFFGLPIVSPLFALSGVEESSLPACCRRGGQHHCMAMMHGGSADASHRWSAQAEKCPYCPASVAAWHGDRVGLTSAQAIFAEMVSHPAAHAQTKSKWRIARERSRHKRGPPSSLNA